MYFKVGAAPSGDYTWRLYGNTNEVAAWAGESFPSLPFATRACKAFKVSAYTARFEIYEGTGAKWRWRAWESSNKVAASGTAFPSKADAERAAENVRRNADEATGP